MRQVERTAGPRRWLTIGLLVVAVIGIAAASVFAVRLYQRRSRPPPPSRQTDVALIAGWMTVPYVARSYGIPPPDLFRALDLPPAGNERRSLNDLAGASARSSAELVSTVQLIVQDWKSSHPSQSGAVPAPSGPRGPPITGTAAPP